MNSATFSQHQAELEQQMDELKEIRKLAFSIQKHLDKLVEGNSLERRHARGHLMSNKDAAIPLLLKQLPESEGKQAVVIMTMLAEMGDARALEVTVGH